MNALFDHSHRANLSRLAEKSCRHWEASRRAEAAQANVPAGKARAFTIALDREVGTQGTLIAEEVGKLLGWHVYDHELLEHIAKEMGLRTALLESVDERNQSWLLETVNEFASMASKSEWGEFVTESEYVHHLIQTVLALGVHGECMIVGRGAAFILPVETTLRVRLVAPVRDRIQSLSRSSNIPEQEAVRKVRTQDRDRADFVQDHFLKDLQDPRNFDLVLNGARLSVRPCAEFIVEALRKVEACEAVSTP